MLANNNLKVCRTLVMRDFKFHPVKNTILILAAMLVTALYTFVFLLGSSVEEGFLLNYQYTYGSTSHILYTGLTDRQADTIAGNANVKSTVRLSTVGQVTDPMIGQRVVKLAVTDRDYAESVLSVPTTGQLPTQPGEIALDEFTMDSLGVLREIGAPVTIQWTDPDGDTHTSQFSLCGWWLSSTNFTEACAWITEETAQTLFPGYDDDAAANVTLGVNLHQPKELDVQAEEILAEQGVAGVNFTTNLAYNDAKREQASGQAQPFYQPALLVLLCGYLMVYSIIHVAARRDLMYYAGLKSLGLTPPPTSAHFAGTGLYCFRCGLSSRLAAGVWHSLLHHQSGDYRHGGESGALFSHMAAFCGGGTLHTGYYAVGIPFTNHPSVSYDACTDHSLSYWQAAKAWT